MVDVSARVLAKYKEVGEHGALSEYQDLENATSRLQSLSKDLSVSDCNKCREGSVECPDECLVELARNCSTTANILVEKLQTLRYDGSRRRRKALLKTLRALWQKKDIQSLQKRLDGYRNVLDTRILIDLRSLRFSLK